MHPMKMSQALTPGQTAGAGRFTLLKLLGRGGMGEVWLAHDGRLNEQAALKFLPPEIHQDAAALDELQRETLKSRKLSHPHIVRIHDLHHAEGEAPFISMEYVDGPNLVSLRVQQPERVLSWEFLRPLVEQLCAALDYAHSEGIIHRDLKPANLMLSSNGRLKLADFGIAAVVNDSATRASARSATSGTLAYMSPQQLAGKRPAVGDDIYALGAALYELLSSKPPFYTGDLTHQILHEAPEPLEERLAALGIHNPIPAGVAALVMACLAKDPGQRPASSAAAAGWIAPSEAAIQSGAGEPPSPLDEPAPRKKYRLAAGVSVVGGLLLLIGGWTWHAISRSARVFELAGRPSVPFAGSLPGTIWKATDSQGDTTWFQFNTNGLLIYEGGRGVRPNGTWQQSGLNVNMNMNDGYVILSGMIADGKMSGNAQSPYGTNWTWQATPKK